MIIFVNGSINAGKSTVAKLLAARLKKTALVEIDRLYEFIDWMEIDDAVPINLENTVAVIRNFSKRGFNVIVPYPLSEKDYRYLMKNLRDLKEKIQVFTLSPKKEKAKKNTVQRKLSKWEKTRIEHHYKIGIPKPSFGTTIDNTKQKPEETAKIILEHLTKSKPLT